MQDSVVVALHPAQPSVSVARLIGVSGESSGLVPTKELSIQHNLELPSTQSIIVVVMVVVVVVVGCFAGFSAHLWGWSTSRRPCRPNRQVEVEGKVFHLL